MKSYLVVGNPNTGKSTLFNALTGLRQKVGNYPGVTVEKTEGTFTHRGETIRLVDMPGTYSLTPSSPDEEIVTQILLGTRPWHHSLDGVIIVADATNLERNLYLTTQIIDCGLPTLLVLNMIDEAISKEIAIDVRTLTRKLGITVLLTTAKKGEGIAPLQDLLAQGFTIPEPLFPKLLFAHTVTREIDRLEWHLTQSGFPRGTRGEALRLLSRDDPLEEYPKEKRKELLHARTKAQEILAEEGVDWRALESDARYAWIEGVCSVAVQHQMHKDRKTMSDKIDAVATNRVAGPILFFVLMAIIFQGLFSWATIPMDFIDQIFSRASNFVNIFFPSGPLQSLMADGVLAGIGAVVTFLPQILFLFLFISILEDTGYMARAAFVMDRLMAKCGLHGKAFIPLLSSFACAIPGIMATRTIESRRDRLVTIMIAPLMSCSARLPVYTLLIAACIPRMKVMGFFNLQGLTMWGLYLLGIVVAIGVAFVLKRTILTSPSMPFLMEMPPYRLPQPKVIWAKTWGRSKLFLTNAGTIIFVLSIVLWFLTSYPKNATLATIPQAQAASVTITTTNQPTSDIEVSFAGRVGKWIEPVIKPLGFNWKIGIGLIASFAAREVFVSTMAIVYRLDDAQESSPSFINALRGDTNPDGSRVFTPRVALSLLVFFVLACQCMSTVAVVKRETNSWRWPLFMIAYMSILAYTASLIIYQGGGLLGFS